MLAGAGEFVRLSEFFPLRRKQFRKDKPLMVDSGHFFSFGGGIFGLGAGGLGGGGGFTSFRSRA